MFLLLVLALVYLLVLDSLWFFIIAFDLGSERGKRVERQTDRQRNRERERQRQRQRRRDREIQRQRNMGDGRRGGGGRLCNAGS